jgi:hypothetical protein
MGLLGGDHGRIIYGSAEPPLLSEIETINGLDAPYSRRESDPALAVLERAGA